MKPQSLQSFLRRAFALTVLLPLLACSKSSSKFREFSGLSRFESCEEMKEFLSVHQGLDGERNQSQDLMSPESGSAGGADKDLPEANLAVEYSDLSIYLDLAKQKLYFFKSSASENIALIAEKNLQTNYWYPREILVIGEHLLVISERSGEGIISHESDGKSSKPPLYRTRLEAFDLKDDSFKKVAEQMLSGEYINARSSTNFESAKVLVREYIFTDSSEPAAEINLPRTAKLSLSTNSAEERVAADCSQTYYIPAAQAVSVWPTNQIYDVKVSGTEIKIEHNFSVINSAWPVVRSTLDSFVMVMDLQGAAQNTQLQEKNTLDGITQSLVVQFEDQGNSVLSLKAQGFVSGTVAEAAHLRSSGNFLHVFSSVRQENLLQNQLPGDRNRPHIWSFESFVPLESRLTSLQRDGQKLTKAKEIKNIGANEFLTGARFVGDRAYAVTASLATIEESRPCLGMWFDPYKIFDLSNPKEPVLVGSLDLDGYTKILLPAFGNILGLGRSGSGEIRAILFNGDRAEILDQKILANAATASFVVDSLFFSMMAPEVHKTYAYSGGLLAFPVERRESCESRTWQNEIQFVRADSNQIENLGSLSEFLPASPPRRILLKGNSVLTFSSEKVMRSSQASPTEVIQSLIIE